MATDDVRDVLTYTLDDAGTEWRRRLRSTIDSGTGQITCGRRVCPYDYEDLTEP